MVTMIKRSLLKTAALDPVGPLLFVLMVFVAIFMGFALVGAVVSASIWAFDLVIATIKAACGGLMNLLHF